LQKIFCFLSEKTPQAGLLREKKKFFLQKNFFFSLFGLKNIFVKFSFVQPDDRARMRKNPFATPLNFSVADLLQGCYWVGLKKNGIALVAEQLYILAK
jgi:hypothetical protein